MEIFAAVALVVMVALAVFDVFWPFTVVIVCAAAAGWWLGRSGEALALFRPDLFAFYIVAGIGWVFFKWTRLVETAWKHRSRSDARPPKWEDHTYDFAAYFFYWPIDLIAYVLSDFLREAWNFIASIVGRSFDRYAEWRFRA
jgi:hypothetical protein